MGGALEGPHYRKEKIMELLSIYHFDDSVAQLRSLVSDLAGYAGIEDICITYDTCIMDFKLFT